MPMRMLLIVALIVGCAGVSDAAVPGFVEDFATDSGGFSGGSTVTRITSGGVGGASDPYIEISNASPSQLGTRSTVPELNGNLPADGVTGYSFWLLDTGTDDALEIHVTVGIQFSNVWQNLQGFAPPQGDWQQFSVDLTDPSQWVRIIGSGTFAEALAGSTALHFRHDLAPYQQFPDSLAGDFGLDRIQVLPAPPEVPAVSAPGLALLGALLVAIAALGVRAAAHGSPAARR